MSADNPGSFHLRLESFFRSTGNVLVSSFHYAALFVIGAAVVWSSLQELLGMMKSGHMSIDDILLLFIYLELGAMVGIYFKTKRMPVRFLIYVGITALTRMLLGDIQSHHNNPDKGLLIISGGILILALANLVIRYGSTKYPSTPSAEVDGIDVSN